MERRKTNSDAEGLTLIEALLSVVILALMASVIGALYIGGLNGLAVQGDRLLLDSARRSQMEWLISENLGQLSSGSATTVNGQDKTLNRTVDMIDLDGDTVRLLVDKVLWQ